MLQATGRCERAPYGLLVDGSSHIRLVGFTISEGQKGEGQLTAPLFSVGDDCAQGWEDLWWQLACREGLL